MKSVKFARIGLILSQNDSSHRVLDSWGVLGQFFQKIGNKNKIRIFRQIQIFSDLSGKSPNKRPPPIWGTPTGHTYRAHLRGTGACLFNVPGTVRPNWGGRGGLDELGRSASGQGITFWGLSFKVFAFHLKLSEALVCSRASGDNFLRSFFWLFCVSFEAFRNSRLFSCLRG